MDNKLTTQQVLANIYPLVDIPLAFSELSPRTSKSSKHFACECPSCGQKRAYIHYSKSGVLMITCNRKDSCGYYENIWTYVQKRDSLDNKGTLLKLAEYANYNLETNLRVVGASQAQVFTDAKQYFDTAWSNLDGKNMSVDYSQYADESKLKYGIYRFMEWSGLSTF